MNFEHIYVGINDINLGRMLKNFNRTNSDIFIFKSQERIFMSAFTRIINMLNNTKNFVFSDDWKYKKFSSNNTKIIFIDSSYVLTKECINAIQKTGNELKYLHIDIEKVDYEIFLKDLLTTIKEFKPDFILTINHLGFDAEGRLTEIFHELELPFVSWFVDSPNVILSNYSGNTSEYANIFVWDDDYINDVKDRGFSNCDFLPLATDSSIFKYKQKKMLYDVSFVGSSMIYSVHKNMQSWINREDLMSIFYECIHYFTEKKTRNASVVLEVLNEKKINFDNDDQKEDFLAAVLWNATLNYRLQGINELSNFKTVISGDINWKNLLPISYKLLPERWYYDNLCDFYNQSKINFNMTSLQMTNAVNQRLFDVSACRQFIITDYRKQIDTLFEGNKNIVYFNEIGEIKDLVDFYLNNKKECDSFADKAYNLVMKNHLYEHRIKNIIETINKRYSY
jgi:spore maturation protein CgeB